MEIVGISDFELEMWWLDSVKGVREPHAHSTDGLSNSTPGLYAAPDSLCLLPLVWENKAWPWSWPACIFLLLNRKPGRDPRFQISERRCIEIVRDLFFLYLIPTIPQFVVQLVLQYASRRHKSYLSPTIGSNNPNIKTIFPWVNRKLYHKPRNNVSCQHLNMGFQHHGVVVNTLNDSTSP